MARPLVGNYLHLFQQLSDDDVEEFLANVDEISRYVRTGEVMQDAH